MKIEDSVEVVCPLGASRIVFSVPHDAPARSEMLDGRFGLRSSGQRKRDLFVSYIVRDIVERVSSTMVRGLVPRTLVDYNRTEKLAYEDSRLKAYYDYYHAAVKGRLGAGGVLFDMHGFASGKEEGREFDLILSSRGGETLRGERVDLLLADELRGRGYSIFTANTLADIPQTTIFATGFTTTKYSGEGVAALQIEISDKFRQKETRELGVRLSCDLADFFLKNPLLFESSNSAQDFERNREDHSV